MFIYVGNDQLVNTEIPPNSETLPCIPQHVTKNEETRCTNAPINIWEDDDIPEECTKPSPPSPTQSVSAPVSDTICNEDQKLEAALPEEEVLLPVDGCSFKHNVKRNTYHLVSLLYLFSYW